MGKNTYRKKYNNPEKIHKKNSIFFLLLIAFFIAITVLNFVEKTFYNIKYENTLNVIYGGSYLTEQNSIQDNKSASLPQAENELQGIHKFCIKTISSNCINEELQSFSGELKLAEKKEDEDIKDLEGNIKNQLDKLDLSELEKFLSDITTEDKIFNSEIKDILKQIINGTYEGGYSDFVKKLFSNVMKSIVDFLPMLVTIVAIAILFSLMNNLSSGFLNKSTTEIIYFVCYSAIIILVVTKTASLVLITTNTISSMQQLMNIIFPMLLTLVTALGGFVSVSAYKPMMAVASTVIVNVITKLVIPCFIAMLVFSIVGNMSKNIKLDKMNRFFKSIAEYTLGILFSLFMAFTTMQGITGAINDTISIKSAKFAIGSYVPVLGGYLSEGFDLILASCVLIKNSIGVVGIIIIMTIIFLPIIKIGVFALALKAIAGIIEPIGDRRMSDLLFGISKSLTMLIVAILGVAFMFFVLVMLVIYSCNVGIV